VRSVRMRRKAIQCAKLLANIKQIPWYMRKPQDFKKFAEHIPDSMKKSVMEARVVVRSAYGEA
jgi:hypothetical protein